MADVDNQSRTPFSPVGNDHFSPLRSPESLAAYCSDVQNRLADRAAHRRRFLLEARERFQALYYAAQAVEDDALAQELAARVNSVRELLEAATKSSHATPQNRQDYSPPTANRPQQQQPPAYAVRQENPPVSEVQNGSHAPDAPPAPDAPKLPRRPVRPLPDIEAEAIQFRGSLHKWNEQFPLAKEDGSGLHISNSLRLRAVACRQRRLEEEAGDTEVAEVTELGDDLETLMDEAGDQEYTVSLDYELDSVPTAYQWGELAERYEEMAQAYEAFDWWNENWPNLTVQEVQPLAEAVAAIQQRFNRLLFRIGAKDPYQQALFDNLRSWAREAQCYLHSLRPKVPIAELIERASTLRSAWDSAKAQVEVSKSRGKMLDQLEEMIDEPDFGSAGDTDELRLHELLLTLREARVPPTDRRLRDALAPWGAFLEGEDRFRDILKEVHLEWERRQEAGKTDEDPLEDQDAIDAVSKQLDKLRPITRGRRIVLLGGIPREDAAEKIRETLGFDTVQWLKTMPEQASSDFEAQIADATAVGIFTKYSRKEWKRIAETCRRDGKKFWRFSCSFQPSRIVKDLYADEIGK